ncbi:unnamed protein product [Vicia faba]|uniref:F-box domain-containing protein n=1 Tax=Vicia faba TaxID=3906 RepID=A0AAV0YN29_VICFA|nr:unnamed protein product [Vicia faba]
MSKRKQPSISTKDRSTVLSRQPSISTKDRSTSRKRSNSTKDRVTSLLRIEPLSSSNPTLVQDRINDLPDPILCHILSYLSTKLAVRTSILSRRWKTIWLSVPTFDMFDFHPKNVVCSAIQAMLSSDIKSPIPLVRFMGSDPEIVNNLVTSAIQRGVETLKLSLYCSTLEMKSLSNILTCKTLTVLKLLTLWFLIFFGL